MIEECGINQARVRVPQVSLVCNRPQHTYPTTNTVAELNRTVILRFIGAVN